MYDKSVDFLLENAGPIIQYRLRKEILKNITKPEEENYLDQIYQTPNFKLVQKYIKPNGYIGIGAHSWDMFKETPLQDGEGAARLLSYYAVPKDHPYIADFVKAMRNKETLRHEFSYYKPEIPRFERRFDGLNNGNSLAALLYVMQAMMGYGDDTPEVLDFQAIALKGFKRVLELSALSDITTFNPNVHRKYNYPYIEADEYFPDVYTLAMLAYTQSWRTDENVYMLAESINHIDRIMKPDNIMHVRINGKYVGPGFPFIKPFKPFTADRTDAIDYRRPLTEIAMLGVGNAANVIKESVANLEEVLSVDGILRMNFESSYRKRQFFEAAKWPGAYADIFLETDHKRKNALECDLTFWAVQFLHLVQSLPHTSRTA